MEININRTRPIEASIWLPAITGKQHSDESTDDKTGGNDCLRTNIGSRLKALRCWRIYVPSHLRRRNSIDMIVPSPNRLIYVVPFQWCGRYNVVSSEILAAVHVIMQIGYIIFFSAKPSISQSFNMKTIARETTKLDSIHRRGKQLVLMSLLLCRRRRLQPVRYCARCEMIPAFSLAEKRESIYLLFYLIQ